MSRKAIKSINWAALAERVPESEKAAFVAFKAKSDQYLQRMMAQPEAPPAIDWAYYKKNISSNLVDKFQQQYESLSIPYPPDNYTAQIDAEKQEMDQKIKSYIEQMNTSIQEINVHLDFYKNMIPISMMTLEDYCILFPNGTFSKKKVSIWPHVPEEQDEEPKDESKDQKAH